MELQDEDIEYSFEKDNETYLIFSTGKMKAGAEVYNIIRENDHAYVGNLNVSMNEDALDVVSRWAQLKAV